MAHSKLIGSILGPTLVAMIASEFPLVQPDLYATQIPPVVYVSGVLMFIAGLAIVRFHNVWSRSWTVLITLTGWGLLALGLTRMFFASQYRQASAGTAPSIFMVLEAVLLLTALIVTFKSYRGQT